MKRNAASRPTAIAVVLAALVVVLGVSALVAAPAYAAETLTVQAYPFYTLNGDSAQIQVNVQSGPVGTDTVTIKVTPPTSPINAGGPFCVTETVPTDNNGNGQVTVSYPDTGNPSALFKASACSPAGTGGPTTIVTGSYGVQVSDSSCGGTSGVACPTTTFTGLPAFHEVTGTGTTSSQTTVTVSFIPATGCTTGNGTTCVVSCSGPTFTAAAIPTATSTPSESTAPFLYYAVGSQELTGIITSNTPATREANNVASPCGVTAPTVLQLVVNVVDTYSSVTIATPGENPVTGGLIVTESGTTTTTGTPGVSTASITLAQWTLVGTGPLAGVTGVGEAMASTVTTVSAAGVGTTIGTSQYWVQLTNVPGT